MIESLSKKNLPYKISLGNIIQDNRSISISPPFNLYVSVANDGTVVARCEEIGLIVEDYNSDGAVHILCKKIVWLWDEVCEMPTWQMLSETDKLFLDRVTEASSLV